MSAPHALPPARTLDPLTAPVLRWGVMGPGWIAERFVRAVRTRTRQQITAVASRDADRAREFADRMEVPRAHGGYDLLVADPHVDVVYVATPHPAHHACAMQALTAGKHVLVEKPIAINATQAGEIADVAAERALFCAEALWTFFLPKFDVIRQVITAGMLGTLRTVIADHGEHFGPNHRIMRADLAGGPLFDLGTYPLALATEFLDEITQVTAVGQDAPSGVNGQVSMLLTDTGGSQALLHSTILSDTPTTAVLAGTQGTLAIPGPFYMPGPFSITFTDDRPALRYDEEAVGHHALYYQAAEVARAISAGALETGQRTLDASIRSMRVMDSVRRAIGVSYPEDSAALS